MYILSTYVCMYVFLYEQQNALATANHNNDISNNNNNTHRATFKQQQGTNMPQQGRLGLPPSVR